jgi:tripartite-type tricarboxylate transporter receptor subunit TctC
MLRVVCALLCTVCLAGSALAQSWPVKPARIVVANQPGTVPDRVARLVAEGLGKQFGQGFTVENNTGAGGLIATQSVVRSAPDGYTFLFASVGALITDPRQYANPGYDPDRDLQLIAMLYEQSRLSITVNASVPARNLEELIALAKSRPGGLSYGVPNAALLSMVGRWFNHLAGTEMVEVKYTNTGQQFQDLVTGRIDWVIATVPQLMPFVKAGKLRIIALDGDGRMPQLPDVPTMTETFPGYRTSGFGILAAPRGVSPGIVAPLNAAVDKVVRSPEYVRRLSEMFVSVNGAGTPEYIASFTRERREYWDRIFTTLKVQPQ